MSFEILNFHFPYLSICQFDIFYHFYSIRIEKIIVTLGYLLASKVDLVTILIEIYGWLFLIVWCGAFGRREMVGVLKTLSVPCLTSSFYFSELYWIGSLCEGTILFLLFWIYLIFIMFVLDLFTPVYPLCTWVSLSF